MILLSDLGSYDFLIKAKETLTGKLKRLAYKAFDMRKPVFSLFRRSKIMVNRYLEGIHWAIPDSEFLFS